MAVAVCPLAAQVALDTMKSGGNAIDAAVAAAFALAVSWPEAGNIGGGGFMVVYPGPGQEPLVIDYREVAPAAATATMLADKNKVTQYKLVGVPGTVSGLALAHEKLGSLSWRDLVLPAAKLAREGFTVDEPLARSLNRALGTAQRFAEFRRVYGKDGRATWQPGDRLTLPELADTLDRIAEHGVGGFYEGRTAELLAGEMEAGGGLVSAADLRDYRAKVRRPIHGTFRGYHIYSAPPPSSGGIALVEMLNILENFSFEPGARYSPSTLHLLVESMRRAYRDRARWLGDPDFVEVPEKLISKEHAKQLASSIDPRRARPSRDLADDIAIIEDGPQTTHFSIVDAQGMAVSNTYTLEQAFGSRIVVRGGGFLLNNEMGDFNPRPGETNDKGQIGTPANTVAPGKRMLSSMTPTIVTTPDGRPLLVTGSPGGRTIINTVACVVWNTLEFRMPIAEAVDSPRLHHAWFPDRIQLEPSFIERHAAAVDALKGMGHAITGIPIVQGDAHTIWIDPETNVRFGVADPRRRGAARGY
jgi:gamma-glutamyltranspeptidase / glutathione hydrolase